MMNEEFLCMFLNKYVTIYLTNKFYYSGKILSIKKHTILLLDIFNEKIVINANEIVSITPTTNSKKT